MVSSTNILAHHKEKQNVTRMEQKRRHMFSRWRANLETKEHRSSPHLSSPPPPYFSLATTFMFDYNTNQWKKEKIYILILIRMVIWAHNRPKKFCRLYNLLSCFILNVLAKFFIKGCWSSEKKYGLTIRMKLQITITWGQLQVITGNYR